MDVIVVSQRRERTWRFRVSAKSPLLWGPAALLMCGTVAGSFAIGWQARGMGTRLPVDLAQSWTQQIADQRAELDALRIQARADAQELASRMDHVEARALRIDAAAAKVGDIAGLDPSAFNFLKPPPVGGPEPASGEEPSEADPILASLAAFEARLDERERQMKVLSDLLLAGRQFKKLQSPGWPIQNGYISSVYGWRADPFNGRRALHPGIDFAGAAGSDVLAVAGGTIQEAGRVEGYGLTVEVNHGNGYVTRYGHNSRLSVKVGDKIEKGQKIASMGSSGRSTGPHVHFEVLLNGVQVNPAQYIAAGQ
ncbi:MAG TPA: M23 family metallopeptidase [Nevskiaceae bacterium]|nr:M23 family metallopeptidase [Nevskiaceae bacterium]